MDCGWAACSTFLEHLGRELIEVEVVPPGGNEPIVDLDDPHHRQRSRPSVGSREVVDALSHDDRAFGHHEENVDMDASAYPHELLEGRFDRDASSDWLQWAVVIHRVLAEEWPQRGRVSFGPGLHEGGHEVLNRFYGSGHAAPSKELTRGGPQPDTPLASGRPLAGRPVVVRAAQ